MARRVRGVDEAIARFDDIVGRIDGRSAEAMRASRRAYGRELRSLGTRLGYMGTAIAILIAATIAFGLVVGPIGIGGLFLVAAAMLLVLILFSVWPAEPRKIELTPQTPMRQIVRQLDSYLVRQRPALPAPAARKVDEISARLPLLESRLAEADLLDPLAQDARRLMGKHLPDLIERYERVPAAYRHERDGEGMTVDERLIAGLDAANTALDDLSRKLAHEDMTAFETQGRFIESRYKDGGGLKGE